MYKRKDFCENCIDEMQTNYEYFKNEYGFGMCELVC